MSCLYNRLNSKGIGLISLKVGCLFYRQIMLRKQVQACLDTKGKEQGTDPAGPVQPCYKY